MCVCCPLARRTGGGAVAMPMCSWRWNVARRLRRRLTCGAAAAQDGCTALICSGSNGRADCVRLLLDAGADKEAKDRVRVSEGDAFGALWSGAMMMGWCETNHAICIYIFIFHVLHVDHLFFCVLVRRIVAPRRKNFGCW